MPDRSNIPKGLIKEKEIDRRFADLFKPPDPMIQMMTWSAYEDLCSRAHKCFLHQQLPIIVVEAFSPDEWAYRTPPSRLEVSCELMEEIRTWKGKITQSELERLLDSTRRRHVELARAEPRNPDKLKGITE